MKNTRILISMLIIALFIATSCEELEKAEKILTVDFKYMPDKPKVNEEVTFTSICQNAEEYSWNFGDNETSTAENPTHIYQQEGSYEVTLTVKDIDGKTESKKKTIEVSIDEGAIVEHSKDIKADETWSSKQVHLVTTYIDIDNATLTIEAGAIVQFKDDAGLRFGEHESQNSKLIAKGTAEKRITFTSAKASPQEGDWYGISFGKFADTESIMEYCDISYAGGLNAIPTGSIIVEDKNIIFNHNKVINSLSNGIYCNKNAYFTSFEANKVNNCKGNAIYIYANYVHTLGVEKGERSEIDNNSLHGIYVDAGYNMDKTGNFVWQNLGARYTIDDFLHIGSVQGTTLTIEEGNTMAFLEDAGIKVGTYDNKTGKLIAQGTETAKIKFISEKLGSSSGTWYGLFFGDYNAEGSILEHCTIESAGGENAEPTAALNVYKSSIKCNNTQIIKSAANGIHCGDDGNFVEFTNNTVSESAESSILMSAQWAHTIGANNQIANDLYGIALYGDFDHKNKEFHWLKQTCPYTLVGSLNIGSAQGCTLIIDAGNKIQVAQDKEIEVGCHDNKTGTLIAKGTENERIVFAPATATGTWDYIYFGQGTGQTTILENCDIINAGDQNSIPTASIVCRYITLQGTPTLRNLLVKNSKSNGILTYKNTNPVIENITYENIKDENIVNTD